jgi:NADP-dependent 3-hydroxy acid dehydrogenase YdfG
MRRRALVTGASAGIGAATARQLAAAGYQVIAAARRLDRLENLAAEINAEIGVDVVVPFRLDVTDDDSVAELVTYLEDSGGLDVVVNNAGGAFGLDPIAEAVIERWQRLYDINLLGTLRVTKAVLPLLKATAESSGGSDIVVVTSTASLAPYEGGAGYTSAKHAERVLATTLRWELAGEPIRVIQIEPGAVHTEEFALNRFDGDATRAAATYAGLTPLTADDIAEAIVWTLSRPANVNIDHLTIRPRAQVSNWKTARNDGQVRTHP